MRKIFIFLSVLLSCSEIAGGDSIRPADCLAINMNGELLIKGNKKWSREDFAKLGFSFYKDDEVYISEGVLAKKDNDYDEAILFEKAPLLYFEIRNGVIERGVLLSSEIPVVIKSKVLTYKIGVSLATISESFKEIEILSAEGQGVYATYKGLENLSFGSACSFFPHELTEQQKKMTREELLKECKVNSIIFLGNEGMAWR